MGPQEIAVTKTSLQVMCSLNVSPWRTVWYLNGLADTSYMVQLPEAFAWLNCPNMQLFSTLVSYTSV